MEVPASRGALGGNFSLVCREATLKFPRGSGNFSLEEINRDPHEAGTEIKSALGWLAIFWLLVLLG